MESPLKTCYTSPVTQESKEVKDNKEIKEVQESTHNKYQDTNGDFILAFTD